MDQKLFRQRLEQLAVIRDKKPVKTASHNRLAKETIVEIDEDGNEVEIEVEIKENPTLGIEIVKIRDRTEVCDLGCGKIVTNQIVESRLVTFPERHWRTRCKNCECFVSPDGMSFIEGGHMVQDAFMKYFRQLRSEEIITSEGIIRKYK